MTKAFSWVLIAVACALLLLLWRLQRHGAPPKPRAEPTHAPAAGQVSSRAPGPRPQRPELSPGKPAEQPDIAVAPTSPASPDNQTENWVVALSQRNLAYQAYRAGAMERALMHAQAALALQPDDEPAHRVAALAACRLGHEDIAQDHADRLERTRFERVERMCRAYGIALRHPYDPLPADAGPVP